MSHADNILGLLSLLAYTATLLPSNVKVIYPALKFSAAVRVLFRYRREVGIGTFVLSVLHACVAVAHHRMNFLAKDFYTQSVSGLLILFVFALLAFTSNRWSIRKLKKNWKRLHALTYVTIFLIPWHIAAKMSGQWTLFTAVAVPLAMGTVCLFCLRKYIEGRKKLFYAAQWATPSATPVSQRVCSCLEFCLKSGLTSVCNLFAYKDNTCKDNTCKDNTYKDNKVLGKQKAALPSTSMSQNAQPEGSERLERLGFYPVGCGLISANGLSLIEPSLVESSLAEPSFTGSRSTKPNSTTKSNSTTKLKSTTLSNARYKA